MFVDTKMSTLSEIGQHMSSACDVYLTNESVHQGAKGRVHGVSVTMFVCLWTQK